MESLVSLSVDGGLLHAQFAAKPVNRTLLGIQIQSLQNKPFVIG